MLEPRILPCPTLPMRYQNLVKPSLIVEIIHPDAEFRVGENRWLSVVYRRVDNGRIYVRPKAEFVTKFAPLQEK